MNDCRRIRAGRRGRVAAETALDVGCALLCAAVMAFMTAWIATAWAAGTASPHMGLYDGTPTQGEAEPSGAGRNSPVLPRNKKTEASVSGEETQDAPEEAQEAAEARMDLGMQEYRPASVLPAEASEEAERADEGPVRLTEEERAVVYIAKALYGECRGCTKTEQAAVVWCILNRVDSELPYMPDDIVSVVTQPKQFAGYADDKPVLEGLVEIAEDVMMRWKREKNGETDVGRVLPKEYLYFWGDKKHNYFRMELESFEYWDWSLESPYESLGRAR